MAQIQLFMSVFVSLASDVHRLSPLYNLHIQKNIVFITERPIYDCLLL